MMPWLASITDTLEVLHKNDESLDGSLNYIMDKAKIQFKSVNFMRGRSIQNSFVLLDECQNLTASQLKTIITRCGEGTKLVCSGNLAQIDSNYLTAVTSGLTYIVERFKNFHRQRQYLPKWCCQKPLSTLCRGEFVEGFAVSRKTEKANMRVLAFLYMTSKMELSRHQR